MSTLNTTRPATQGKIRLDPAMDHAMPLAMPESPMPDWAARNRTPDPLAEAPVALKPAA